MNKKYADIYTIEVKLGKEVIGLIGNIEAINLEFAIEEAKEYVESSWQGYRVHPTELSALTYTRKHLEKKGYYEYE